ncbi:isoaspartyl peptidase/L-asparaginase family protein [Prolixibacter sp. NT017]|uniref:isoaspartyl peptidase/L-asparaginase family protein n=1 Tax=Prolixibacter sp. NT017 TaxID=2652390 RepID=UPI00126B8590|nr:isoaspartyl peptidase/L-asparaginase [Prolixibacter sp. NT017]GET27462.1 isoaspartyl peptidase/L-asparaginase [Prolixibacter sp. NT017]
MNRTAFLLGYLFLFLFTSFLSTPSQAQPPKYVLVIHGGAGVISRENLGPELEKQFRDKLSEALDTGKAVLSRGGTAIDAVEHTIRVMEDSPLFNAGKGAVFSHYGTNEMDAAIMDGSTLNAGAVAGVGDVKNPISLARKVMEKSEHVMLYGSGASEFARQQELTIVDSSYFFTQRRWDALQRYLAKEGKNKFGTVGCAALDQYGNLAAGTSTGGMTNKKFHRIGDSPIIGAGTYASNQSCAISCTGHGEFFIRYTVARTIAALMEYKQLSFHDVANEIINNELVKSGGDGGMIGVDKDGNVVMMMNTPGMFRGFVKSTGDKYVAIYGDEE